MVEVRVSNGLLYRWVLNALALLAVSFLYSGAPL